MQAVLKAQINKTDRNDARGIAQMMRVGLYRPVHVKDVYKRQIFNAMARIDKRVVEAALDAGASRFEIMWLIVLPLSKNGIALGSIFVVSIVMGDFFVIKVMSGGGSASVVGALYEDVGVLQYPSAAASAVVLTIVVTMLITAILRTVDVRKELTR